MNGKKIPCIPSINHNDKSLSDIKKKSDFLNTYFVEQCTSLINNSKLQSALIVHTKSLLESFHFSADHVGGD